MEGPGLPQPTWSASKQTAHENERFQGTVCFKKAKVLKCLFLFCDRFLKQKSRGLLAVYEKLTFYTHFRVFLAVCDYAAAIATPCS